MKKEFLIILFIIIFQQSFSQIYIKGKVTDHKQTPILGATISFSNGEKDGGIISNEEGQFNFIVPQTGTYKIKISFVGFIPITKVYDFLDNKSYDLGTIVLQGDIQQLQTIEIVGRIKRDYASDYSFSATKIAIANKELPQSISSVTKESIADRQAFQLSDAIKTASSVIPNSFYNQFSIRGLNQNEEGAIINGMRTHQYFFTQPITSNIERVEVVKGPASATFSSVDPGGSINLVTKKPLHINRNEVNLSVGSYSTSRATIDFTGPLNEDKTLLYRVNGAYQEGKSFRDLQGQKTLLISPSFSYIPNDKTAVNAELIYSSIDTKLDRGQPIFGAVAGKTDLKSTPISLALNATNDYLKNREFIFITNLSHKFTDKITFNGTYMKQTWSEDLAEHRTENKFAVDKNGNEVSTLAAMRFWIRQHNWNTDNLNAYLNFDIDLGNIHTKTLIGYDINRWKKLKGGGLNSARGYVKKDGTTSRKYDPAKSDEFEMITVNGIEIPKPNVDHFDLENPTYTIKKIDNYIYSNTALASALTTSQAAYIQTQLKWKKLSILLGLRNEWFNDITNYDTNNETKISQSELIGRAGITYAINDDINVYGTYLEGYQPHANTVNLVSNAYYLPAGSSLDPLQSDLYEIGAKIDLFNDKVKLTTSIYSINQKNVLVEDPDDIGKYITRGKERSRGFEMELAGYILPNWQLNASYSYIDARIIKSNDPKLDNARKENTPIHSGTIWTRYDFDSTSILKDIGVGLGMQHREEVIPWFIRDFTVPSYTIFDLALYYTPSKKRNFQIALNVNNVLDETYWIGAQHYLRLFPGTPRNIMLTTTYKF
ncbi:TonB-dependent receptor domain-containing protein [Aquimarina longa]|uniref:TonB-dependent receptor domain-containing protein n=1 Tax=Aquimarina longa TaxID=1080221 RepID=UPI00078432AD|nr:TonB-dependent receptor [Aquimarina longa]